jgi:tetratricopeptide (TPR) repeat protein
MSTVKPGAEVQRFKAGDVRVLPAERVSKRALALLEVEGLKTVAGILRSSGLVQVDEEKRTFGMHQLLQQAVGTELGWQLQCERMQALLHARFGKFGDENHLDQRLHGVMRDVLDSAVVAVERIRAEGSEHAMAWCSGMLLRLYEVARDVYGVETKIPKRVLDAAHSSLVSVLAFEHLMRKGCTTSGRDKSLLAIAQKFHIKNVIEISRHLDFDLRKCLSAYWSASTHASLVTHLVHALVTEEGSTSSLGKTMPMQAIAAKTLIGDVIGLRPDFGLIKCLQHRCAESRLVVENGGKSVRTIGDAAREEDWVVSFGFRLHLRAMRWRFHTLKGNEVSFKQVISEILDVYDAQEEGADKWEVGVALGTAFHSARFNSRPETRGQQIDAYERALCLRLDTLGELHPATAATLKALACLYHETGAYDSAIMLTERALRIERAIVGLHPSTAETMISLGASYGKKKGMDKEIELYEQALRIYEGAFGKMHPLAANVIYNMGTLHENLGDLQKAEEMMQESLDIRTITLGPEHKDTIKANDGLRSFRDNMRRQGGDSRRGAVDLEVGSRIRVQGLTTKAEINGRTGCISGAFNQQTERWTVEIDEDGTRPALTLAIRPANLVVQIFSTPLKLGSIVRIKVLDADINGRTGFIWKEFDHNSGRVGVQIDDDNGPIANKRVAIRPVNLSVVQFLQEGMLVRIERLQSRAELNGRTGFICNAFTVLQVAGRCKGRWTVQIDGAGPPRKVSICPANLTVIRVSQHQPSIVVCGGPSVRTSTSITLQHGTYQGEVEDGKFNGLGVFMQTIDGRPSGSVHEGSSGDIYNGGWLDGERDGKCMYTFFNGERFDCTWKSGCCPEFAARQIEVLAAPDWMSVQARAAAAVSKLKAAAATAGGGNALSSSSPPSSKFKKCPQCRERCIDLVCDSSLGFGFVLSYSNGFEVISIDPSSPAAGCLQVGQRIVAINDVDMRHLDAVGRIQVIQVLKTSSQAKFHICYNC